jgi:hypothetical protein
MTRSPSFCYSSRLLHQCSRIGAGGNGEPRRTLPGGTTKVASVAGIREGARPNGVLN